MVSAQIIMVATLALMISGRAPIYLTAIIGSSIAGVVAGFPLSGTADITIIKLINSGLHPVLVDMLGVLLFIGIMQATGFLQVIIKQIMDWGRKFGGGAGVCCAGGIAAGIIGALTGFTQPAITAVITGPAAVRLGVDSSEAAGIQSHAGILGNFAGFTHPTMIAIVATAGIQFGLLNVVGAICALSIFAVSFYRIRKKTVNVSLADIADDMENSIECPDVSFGKAVTPFLVLVIGFAVGLPIILVGIAAALSVAVLSGTKPSAAQAAMMDGLKLIAIPFLATVAFLFMSAMINRVGLVTVISDLIRPYIAFAPIQIMLVVSAIVGTVTQSNAASAAVVVPFLQIVLGMEGVDPLSAATAAVGGCAIMQYYLTGGPVSALATVIPVIPGSELKAANAFQRPAMLVGLLVAFLFTFIV